MNLKHLGLALVAAAALLAGTANAAASGVWTQVTPTTVAVGTSPVRSWATNMTSPTLVAQPLVGSKKGCWSVDIKSSASGSDSATIAGYPISPSTVFGDANISTTVAAAQLLSTAGQHFKVDGQAQTVQPYITGLAGTTATYKLVATEIGNCQR